MDAMQMMFDAYYEMRMESKVQESEQMKQIFDEIETLISRGQKVSDIMTDVTMYAKEAEKIAFAAGIKTGASLEREIGGAKV